MTKCAKTCKLVCKIRAYSICISIYAYASICLTSATVKEQAQVKIQCYMPVIVQIAREHYFIVYSTVRRHRSIFGVNAQAGLRLEGLGVSCSTREASVAGGFCLWPVGFICGSCISTCTCAYMQSTLYTFTSY